ncbi:uncharacterized protein LOC124893390, partial [Capsicum annuum]|uniref:uncharacterized protein LOC124893390 n=1 Tax=Capsicum annuum TaxID=4072 RepID=UPI001FB04ED9
MSKFVTGVSGLVLKVCRTAMLNKDMYLARLMIYAQQIEADKYRRTHPRKSLAEQRGYFGCGKLGHKLREYSHARQGNKDVRLQTQANSAPAPLARPTSSQGASSSTAGGQRQNRFYALPFCQKQEDSPDVVT